MKMKNERKHKDRYNCINTSAGYIARFIEWIQSKTPDFDPDKFRILPYEILEKEGFIVREIGTNNDDRWVIIVYEMWDDIHLLTYKVVEKYIFEGKYCYICNYTNNDHYY